MRAVAVLTVLLWTSVAGAKVINVEFKFSPFVGDPTKVEKVQTVPGLAQVFVNNMLIGEQPVTAQELPVMFDDHEVAAAVWVPAESLGAAVRNGKNTIRFEFTPIDVKTPYRAQLRWASVTDQTTETEEGGKVKETNQANEGVEEKKVAGKVLMEREFVADFAPDLPWHHYPPVTAVSDADAQQVKALVAERATMFKPDFAALYAILKNNPKVDLKALQAAKCLDKAYAAGVRIVTVPADQIEIVTTGGPAIVVQSKSGALFAPADPAAFDKIDGGDEVKMCAGVALFGAFPPRIAIVRDPAGAWEAAY